uniref:Uncharacterized protein n=1 Tax=Oryza rufipogon TaxID=4529 RepID=A0A0E0N1R1_ORYRU
MADCRTWRFLSSSRGQLGTNPSPRRHHPSLLSPAFPRPKRVVGSRLRQCGRGVVDGETKCVLVRHDKVGRAWWWWPARWPAQREVRPVEAEPNEVTSRGD